MRVGRYYRGKEIRPFFTDSQSRALDWAALDCPTVPRQLRKHIDKVLGSGADEDFLAALPLIEHWTESRLIPFRDRNRTFELPSGFLKDPIPPPVRPRNLICVGLNYRDHADESGMQLPAHPLLFAKTPNALTGHQHIIDAPVNCSQLDFEAELAIVIGHTCRSVQAEAALSYVAGYTCINDISARDFQFNDEQWFRGKSCDGFAPIGPWLVTRAEIPDPRGLRIRSLLNGAIMQDSTTANLLFDIPALVEYISAFITLEPGDLIATGTPPGVGFARKPPVYLQDGDRIEIEIEKVGSLRNLIQHTGAPND